MIASARDPAPPGVLFVLPVLGQPRHSKRIAMALAGGLSAEAAAFERDYHKGRLPPCEVTSLGSVRHGNYLARIPRLLAAIRRLRPLVRRNDVVYAFGPDMAVIAAIACFPRRIPVAFEVGDIVYAQLRKGPIGGVVRMIDRWLSHRCGLIVTTTDAFLERYYRDRLGARTPGLVIENKLEPGFADGVQVHPRAAGRPLADRPLRIGYFGLLRCRWSWDVLSELVRREPGRFEVTLAGFPVDPPDLRLRVEGIPGMRYLGEYRSPQDLPGLYGSVDLVWGSYHPLKPDDFPYWWARPNRFYEACLFRRPIISRKGTIDSRDVDRWGIGLSIHEVGVDETVERIRGITAGEVDRWTSAMDSLPRDIYVYREEGPALCRALASLAGSKGRKG